MKQSLLQKLYFNPYPAYDTHACVMKSRLYISTNEGIVIYDLNNNMKKIYTETSFGIINIVGMCIYKDLVYVAMYDNQIFRIYDENGYKYNRSFKSGGIYRIVRISSDDEYLYFLDSNGNVIVLKDEKEVYKFRAHEIQAYNFSYLILYKGKIITFGKNDAIKIWKMDKLQTTIRVASFVVKIIVYNDLIYGFQDHRTISIWDFDGKLIKTVEETEHCEPHSMCIYNDLLYVSYPASVTKIWKGLDIIGTVLPDIWDVVRIISTNNKLYLLEMDYWCNNQQRNSQISIYGEYFPHHYNELHPEQKTIIEKWKAVSKLSAIHKDISLLFIRELL